ncbi:MAG: PASTA domain-containing protein, partial [Oscillospiraceae bacterium]|nr:PASTA domain-containing protein [Oscillospiraceae bacterium]
EYLAGTTLTQKLKELGGRMRWEEARPLFIPLMNSLASFHSAGIFHFGLCPDNLIIGSDGKFHLTGFAIPQAHRANNDIQPVLYPGYTAPEQYQAGSECGEVSDVYAMTAILFFTLTGNPPPDAPARIKNSGELLVPASIAKELPEQVAAGLVGGLQLPIGRRIPTMAALKDKLSAAPAVAALIRENAISPPLQKPYETESALNQAVRIETPEEEEEEEEAPRRWRVWHSLLIVLLAIIVLGVGLVYVLYTLFPEVIGPVLPIDIPTTTAVSTSATEPTTSGESQASTSKILESAVANVVGLNYYTIKDQSFGLRNVEILGVKYNDAPPGTILSQIPEAGETAEINTPIEVFISGGPGRIPIPDLSGWDEVRAKELLLALGFRVGDSVEVSGSEYMRGQVDSSTPAAGTLKDRGSLIVLRISDSDPTTTPPPTTTTLPPATTTSDFLETTTVPPEPIEIEP